MTPTIGTEAAPPLPAQVAEPDPAPLSITAAPALPPLPEGLPPQQGNIIPLPITANLPVSIAGLPIPDQAQVITAGHHLLHPADPDLAIHLHPDLQAVAVAEVPQAAPEEEEGNLKNLALMSIFFIHCVPFSPL
jgi:hypothetical protein